METWYFPRLDAVTLVFSIAMLSYIMAAISFTLAKGVTADRPGLIEWGLSMLCGALAFSLFSYSGHAPFVLTFLVANIFVMGICPLGLLAHTRLFDMAVPLQAIVLTVLMGLSGVVAVYFFGVSRLFAIFTISLSGSIQLGLMAFMIFRATRKRREHLVWISIGAMILLSVAFAMRALLAVFSDPNTVLPSANSMPQIGALGAGALFFATSTIGFLAMVNERQNRKIVERLRRDGLTGLYTRTAFFEMAEDLSRQSSTDGYAIVLVDIDHFKSINDTHGHSGGDAVLTHTARLLASSVRSSDIAVRYGGEEFCILLNDCAEQETANFAERLVAEVSRQPVRLRNGSNVCLTISAGYACKSPASYPAQSSESLEEVIERADQALYRAKNEGRNQARGTLAGGLHSSALA